MGALHLLHLLLPLLPLLPLLLLLLPLLLLLLPLLPLLLLPLLLLPRYSYKNTETPQLWAELEAASGLPVGKVTLLLLPFS